MQRIVVILVAVAALVGAAPASAHLVVKPKCKTMHCRMTSQKQNLAHARYVCHYGANAPKRWSCQAVRWLTRELNETRATLRPKVRTYSLDYWINRQIVIATKIARESGGDPWPNCPDPFDGGGSWYDTARCENGGKWYDSPGYYRCGLQFDPGWERRYGRLCP